MNWLIIKKQLTINELAHNQKTIEELKSNGLKQEYQLMPKGKTELEKIFGTWFFSYTFNGNKHTDKLVITDNFITANDGEIYVSGSLFLNKEEGGRAMVCHELPSDLVSFYGSDYGCSSSNDTGMHTYNFRISGDTVTNGFYGEGATAEEAGSSIVSRNYSITGSRGSEPPPEIEANFNEGSNELIIPVVNYRGSKFRVILQNNGDFLFSVKEAKPL